MLTNHSINQIKRWSGILWMSAGPIALFYLIQTGLSEISRNPIIDTKIQWGVFIVVFIPIAIGMCLFGFYALKGEYDHLPESSEELAEDYEKGTWD